MGKESKLRPAVVTGELETIEFLLKNHSDFGAQDANGTTPLMLAARNNQVALMSILMAHGAFHNTQDHMRETALLIAVPAGSNDAASLLLGCGAEPIIISSRGSTARSLAQEYGHKAISDLIVKALEDAGRVACDPRWPGTLLCITLKALQHDYEVVDYRGVPFIHIMPEPRLLENRTSPFGNCSVRQYDDLFRRGQPKMLGISHSSSDQSIERRRRDSLESLQPASLGLTDAPGLKIPNSEDQSCSQDSTRSSVDSNRAVFDGTTSSSSPHWKVKLSPTENNKQNSKQMRQFLSASVGNGLPTNYELSV